MSTTNVIILILLNLFIALLIYLLFHRVAFKNVYKNAQQSNRHKYGFYECGFRTRHEYTPNYSINAYIICALAILYDVECIFLILFFFNMHIMCLLDIVLVLFYVCLFLVGFYFEYTTRNTEWGFY